MRVLFVQVTSKEGVKGRFASLGLGHLAAVLDKEGIGNKIISCCDEFDLRREIFEYKPTVLALSSVTEFWQTAIDFARVGYQLKLRVIVGGHHISGDPSQLHPFMNVGVVGEGEEVLINVLRDDVKGIVVGNKVKDLGSLPHPKLEAGDNHIMTSRGCPYKCSFCSSSKVWDGYRTFPINWVLDEIHNIQQLNPDNEWIYVWDDLFAADDNRLADLHMAMVRSDLFYGGIKFAIHARVETLNPVTIGMLNLMDVKLVGIGVESGNPDIMCKLKGGKASPEMVKNAIKMLKKAGIKYYCSFILGHPDETTEQLNDTVRFIKRNDIPFFDVNLLTAYPGNDFYGKELYHKPETVKTYRKLKRLRTRRRITNFHRHPRWL